MLQQRSCATQKNILMDKAVLLLVDDDQLITESLSFILNKKYQIYIAETRDQAKEIISSLDAPPQLALVDLGLPPFPHQADEGFALIEDLLAHDPQIKILVLSGQNEDMNIQHALTLGAVDFVPKSADPALLQSRLQHHLMLQHVEKQKSKSIRDSALIGESAPMQLLRQQIEQLSTSLFSVLIEGESGTGKELIAKALHDESSHKDNAYRVINCSAISPDLLESKLFGHVKGAFVGANSEHRGLLAEAENGTLFLDEVDEIPYTVQAKLLRVLESGEYYRVGDAECRQSSARIIAASNKNLVEEVHQGRFRPDLFHRLSILKIHVPALRERGRDRLLLRMHFQNLYEDSIQHFSLNAEANKLWIEYDYPGNVRELRNVVIRLGTKYPSKIITHEILEAEFETDVEKEDVESLKTGFKSGRFNDMWLMKEIASGEFVINEALIELENHCIDMAMTMYDGNLSKVAKALHIKRSDLYSRIQKNIEEGEK